MHREGARTGRRAGGRVGRRGVDQSDEDAALWYWVAAKNDEPWAQYHLGRMYELGRGLPSDPVSAAQWYQMAAERGHGGAQLALGSLYDEGRGVPEAPRQAFQWFERAAEDANMPEAYYLLGTLYETGRGTARDPEQAAYCFGRAAETGHASARHRLGRMLHLGQGIPADENRAIDLFTRAASVGHRESQYMLGTIFESRGTASSRRKARMWYAKAAEQGDVEAMAALQELDAASGTNPRDRREHATHESTARARAERGETAIRREIGVCDMAGSIEMRTRADCLNRGGLFETSSGGDGRFVMLETGGWVQQRRQLQSRIQENPERWVESPRASGIERGISQSGDWIVCNARRGSDSSGRSRYRCASARPKTAETTTAWCRNRGYESRKLFKHESSARGWVSEHCW